MEIQIIDLYGDLETPILTTNWDFRVPCIGETIDVDDTLYFVKGVLTSFDEQKIAVMVVKP